MITRISSSLVLLLLTLLSESAFPSEIQYKLGGIFKNRTFVLGIDGKLSHQTPLWGEKNLILKGYTEESLSFFTAGVSNILEPSIDFFPLAVFGLGAGAYWNQSLSDSMEIKACKDSIQCKGIVQWIYAKATLQARYKELMFRALFQKGKLAKKGASKPFFESATVLIAPAEGSVLETWELTGAYEVNERWTAGVYNLRSTVSADHSTSKLGMFFAKYTPSPWSYLLGLGYFASPVLNTKQSDYKSDIGFLILLSATYNGTFTLF